MTKSDAKKIHDFLYLNQQMYVRETNFCIRQGVYKPYDIALTRGTTLTYEGCLETEFNMIFSFKIQNDYNIWVNDYDMSKLLAACKLKEI